MPECLRIMCLLVIFAGLLQACSPIPSPNQVVVYTSVDQPFSEPILDRFEEETGIRVLAVYDVEAAKTTGLVNRLLAEKSRPQADVFWNSEILQTIRLQQEGALQAYHPPQAAAIPERFRDPSGYWTGNAARARVLIVNTKLIPEPTRIDSLEDLVDPAWPGSMVGIAYPLFGTTATHAAALYSLYGPQSAQEYFQRLAARDVQVVDGNAAVRDLVASGSLAFGLTDTDDACTALVGGAPVTLIFPDQRDIGTLVIPSTVALVAGAPHPAQGQALVDYLLKPKTEQALLDSGYSHVPLHSGLLADGRCVPATTIRSMDVDYMKVFQYFEGAQTDLREIFIR